MRNLPVILGVLASCLASHAFAQDASIAPEEVRAIALAETVTPAWKNMLTLGTTFSFGTSSGVVGAPDGVSAQIGVLADGQSAFTSGRHTWTNTLKLNYAQSRTPAVDSFLKTTDMLDLSTTYTMRLESVRWIGPYARGRFSTQVAGGYLIKPTPYSVIYKEVDGSSSTQSFSGSQFARMTGSFDPMLFGESVGLFANPTESNAATVKLKLGIGSQQLVTSQGFTLDDNKDTAEFEVKRIRNATQVGGELEAQANGQLSTSFSWKAKAAFFMPFYTSITATPTGMDALNMDFSATASYHISKWFSLDYVFSARKVPLITDTWQLQNGAVLTIGFILEPSK
jgi:hypothetical protein